jgi:hypothetical protein
VALLNEILVGRYNRLVQKLLSLKGPASLVQLRGEMGVELPLFHGAENRYLEAWDLFGLVRSNAAPGVGFGSTVTLRNPLGSNVIAVVTAATGQEAASAFEVITLFRPGSAGAGGGDENTVLAAQGWDGRGRPSSTLVISTNVGAAQVGRVGGVAIAGIIGPTGLSNELLRPGDEIPLTPGTLLTLSAGNSNAAFTWRLWWRERFLEDSERT